MKQTDIYTEALICLRSILQTDHPEFKNWIDWLSGILRTGPSGGVGSPTFRGIRWYGLIQ